MALIHGDDGWPIGGVVSERGRPSAGAKVLLVPQHGVILAARGSTQFFLRMYNLILQASFRDDFSIEQVTVELGGVIDRLWPDYERAANAAGIDRQHLHTELVLGGWEPRRGSMIATAFAKSNSAIPAIVQPLDGGLASPGEPLRGWQDSFDLEAVLSAGKIQAWWLSGSVGRKVAGGRLLATVVREGYTVVHDLGDL